MHQVQYFVDVRHLSNTMDSRLYVQTAMASKRTGKEQKEDSQYCFEVIIGHQRLYSQDSQSVHHMTVCAGRVLR